MESLGEAAAKYVAVRDHTPDPLFKLAAWDTETKGKVFASVSRDTGEVEIDWSLVETVANTQQPPCYIAKLMLAIRDGRVKPAVE